MKFVFVADARSTIAQNWISHFIERGHEVHVISSYPCSPDILSGARIYQVPIAFSGLSRISHEGTIGDKKRSNFVSPLLASLRTGSLSTWSTNIFYRIAPFELYRNVQEVSLLISKISPDLVHALRIPFEGIIAAKATPAETPLIISAWGNDFTLFAAKYWMIGRQTRQAMRRADALHCDCHRDRRLARSWGFNAGKPEIVLPGAGGIHTKIFYPGVNGSSLLQDLHIPEGVPVVVNPRGFRQYVRNDIFFEAIPLILQECPETVFICTGMERNPIAEKWVNKLNISRNVRLLPTVPHSRMADLFRLAQITVSPSNHDGTPNTLLEAIACGCFPVAGKTESLEEWINDGVNGFLCDPNSPASVSHAVLEALKDKELRRRARVTNLKLIAERAECVNVMVQAEKLYENLLVKSSKIDRAE